MEKCVRKYEVCYCDKCNNLLESMAKKITTEEDGDRFEEFFMENGEYKFRPKPYVKRFIEKEKLISNIALLTLMVENGKKGDMERAITRMTNKLYKLNLYRDF